MTDNEAKNTRNPRTVGVQVDPLVMCSVCAGESVPADGNTCICGGAGTQEAELDGFRMLVYELEQKMIKIRQWAGSYPISVFPEPDFKKAEKILKENGMTLDSISASNMRHVISGVKDIINT
jgi:hypothetical protein